jgi:hypothetical protein
MATAEHASIAFAPSGEWPDRLHPILVPCGRQWHETSTQRQHTGSGGARQASWFSDPTRLHNLLARTWRRSSWLIWRMTSPVSAFVHCQLRRARRTGPSAPRSARPKRRLSRAASRPFAQSEPAAQVLAQECTGRREQVRRDQIPPELAQDFPLVWCPLVHLIGARGQKGKDPLGAGAPRSSLTAR